MVTREEMIKIIMDYWSTKDMEDIIKKQIEQIDEEKSQRLLTKADMTTIVEVEE
jgi:hypothetical protein